MNWNNERKFEKINSKFEILIPKFERKKYRIKNKE